MLLFASIFGNSHDTLNENKDDKQTCVLENPSFIENKTIGSI